MDKFNDVREIQARGAICCVFVVPLCMGAVTLLGYWVDTAVGMPVFKQHWNIPIWSLVGLHAGLALAIFASVKIIRLSRRPAVVEEKAVAAEQVITPEKPAEQPSWVLPGAYRRRRQVYLSNI